MQAKPVLICENTRKKSNPMDVRVYNRIDDPKVRLPF